MKFSTSSHYKDFSYNKQSEYCPDGYLSAGTTKFSIKENALRIIRAHKKSCKKLIALCESDISVTPDTAIMIKSMEMQIIREIESDLNKINFVYYCYSKCLYGFINIIQEKTRRKIAQKHKLILISNNKNYQKIPVPINTDLEICAIAATGGSTTTGHAYL